ncbi:MAG: InlB B-repeat-containing protein [Clostridia bacterium]|nr:InlB B-repeat-containing protein [Clostridia bacterium]
MKRILSLLLAFILITSGLSIVVNAADPTPAPFDLIATKNGDTVTLSLVTNEELTYANVTFELTVPNTFTLNAINEGADFDEFGCSVSASTVRRRASIVTDDDYHNTVVAEGKEFLVFILDASVAEPASYTFSLKVTAAADIAGKSFSWRGDTIISNMITVGWYTVTWMNGTTAVETDTHVPYGNQPSYNGSVPTKAADAQYTYSFLGWNTVQNATVAISPLPEVTENVTYYAVFTGTLNNYTITWKNDDGTVIDTTTVAYGVTPTHADPTKAPAPQYSWTFDTWTPSITPVTGNAVYTAKFYRRNCLNIHREDTDQDFLYFISGGSFSMFAVIEEGKHDVNVVGLPDGLYEITEVGSWSWRHKMADEDRTQTRWLGEGSRFASVEFATVPPTLSEWLNGYDSLTNLLDMITGH